MSDEQEIYATLIEIREEPTALYKILKIANLVSGGGEAKQAIAEGYVSLNGEVETQKRKKIYAGDLIYFNEQYLQIALAGETQDYEFVEESAVTEQQAESQSDYQASFEPVESNNAPKAKKPRKPISF
ncbi:RNA-binding S4 domain-containing protein [Psychromonas sp. 14N.309.X.WAT.B.A12]|uniref:RNA-binding S4 domain-containing protein n=1 Tax=Psychromonas sp. 14N.309.X.WAT.B.A12 TaxID=2998322 RepID=UPI0025B1FC25|nr:RNA-binding S4 domain-containing protein [Psychromonas sp. 14N.309.X.WAT.B.A12]MDN2663508.1 RNA-binding S4 domain-containing protein [Psychromonas sp. 14N.309.X.WAT.B.A12]